ncbi:23S rRNA (uracil(1939)-C(5))-methyltransferase RlmD [Paenibacillus glycinis]|uniref:23S rRNA (Uracil(1939)-C(5))-methyltransferase RlmD n=1 Tax=Paenibacillus glycinis TaxID=2697035 RepID=A0ABW9XTC7_9BACL|nr:23S rRNA (uracil(1939)-C(5))-methyltransferase RlmD [Paenibacillus glycinis]NBD25601.1 23S rRNA (uracil(1939)-C(5))-methyltransferase RlmD [Paenibacillus glycinis]
MSNKFRGKAKSNAGGKSNPAKHSGAVSGGRSGGAAAGRGGGAGQAGGGNSQAPVGKNDDVTVEIIGLTHEGEGVGRADGFTLFVQGALPGETVRARVMKVKKTYGYAKLEAIVAPSADRVEAPCPIYKQCGGCQLQHMDYAAQLKWKRQHVVDSLERIGKLRVAVTAAGSGSPEDAAAAFTGDRGERGDGHERPTAQQTVIVHPTMGMDDPWHYRNKASVPMGMAVSGAIHGKEGLPAPDLNGEHLIGGFYARGSHRIIDMDECLIQHNSNDEIVARVKRIGRELGITAYNEETGQGLLRHVMARVGFVTGEAMIVLITNGSRIPNADQWIARIRETIPGVTSIVQNVNKRDTNVIFGDETRVLWGSEVIYDELDGIRFAISARSFYQVNPVQTVALYRKAVEYAALTGREQVIDAYCGIGTISLFLARQAGHVHGVEIVPEAIEDAKRNAALNGIENASFEAGAAEVVIPRWRQEGIVPDVIVVDPPRKGCDEALLETILAMRPERVVYVSCNPSTLARDLRVLEDGGYRTAEVQPVDMFPHTVHVECVVWLYRIYK